MKKRIKKVQSKAPQITALAVTPEYRESLKFKRWCDLFFDRTNRGTYGNATQSALRVYNTERYHSAADIGSKNLKKVEHLRVAIMDNEGLGFGELMKLLAAKAIEGGFGDIERLMVRLGYFEPDPRIVSPTNPTNITFNFNNIQEAIIASRKERGLTP